MNESKLLDKLRKIEALRDRAATPGEARAAASAHDRILARLRELRETDPDRHYRFSVPDPWMRRLFMALLRRYGLKPFRYPRQRSTTVRVRVSKRFVDETLWPTFEELSATLREYLTEVTERVITTSIHPDSSDATEVREPSEFAA